ncbi:MAG: hypothetical protein QXL43_03040, partial [Methanolinea sp.]
MAPPSERRGGDGPHPAGPIRRLSHHFNDPEAKWTPWTFTPEANIGLQDLRRTVGALTLQLAGRGQDVKGLLDKPIRLDQYPVPWYFRLGFLQDQNAIAGHVGTKSQVNYAFGLNLAVTFSDPATWPGDRSKRPPRTHDVQLLIVHLGSSGEVAEGLPQYTRDQHPERFLVWGRGDLGYSVMGDWEIPYVEIGNGMKDGGPASPQVNFQCLVTSPTSIAIGVKFNPMMDYRMREIDFAKLYGPATGIWEIGPIISGDRWIPDQLCRVLSHKRGPEPILLGPRWKDGQLEHDWLTIPRPVPAAPEKNVKYLVDYCVFGSAAPKDLTEFSDEFDIPGYLDNGRYQLYGSRIDTHSLPGYLTLTKMGQSLECFAWGSPGHMDFKDFPPPWEIEACVLPPSDKFNWDFNLGFGLVSREGKTLGHWYPGVRNLPVSRRREYFSLTGNVPITFDPPLDPKVIGGERIFMLVQFMDERRVRVGFRAGDRDHWRFSQPTDHQTVLDQPVERLIFVAWNASTSDPPKAESVGFPLYQQYRWDYIRYR